MVRMPACDDDGVMNDTDAGRADGPTPPQPPLPPSPPRMPPHLSWADSLRSLRRSRTDEVFGGVCGGIAAQYGIDAVAVRVIAVALGLLGVGVPLYLAAWLLVPLEGDPDLELGPGRGWRYPVGIVLVAFALLGLFGWGSGNFLDGGFFVAAVLGGLGVWLLLNGRDRTHPLTFAGAASSSVPTTTATTATAAPVPPGSSPDPGSTLPLAPPPGPPAVPPVPAPDPAWGARKRRKRFNGAIIIGSTLVVLGVAGILDASGAVALRWDLFLAVPLLMCGLGLVAASFWGGARGVVPLAILLTVALLAAGVGHWSADVGTVRLSPASVRDDPEPSLLVGELTLDLTATRFGEGTSTIRPAVGVGHLVVIVPAGVSLDVEARTGVGRMTVLGRTSEDNGSEVHVEDTVALSGNRRLEIYASVGIGVLEVRRAS